ncbi:uncharacterized protein LOC116254311 [Nymphaea colorata]|nr:uncharacterized protein LOC116254311 [Nymphaea colorata]
MVFLIKDNNIFRTFSSYYLQLEGPMPPVTRCWNCGSFLGCQCFFFSGVDCTEVVRVQLPPARMKVRRKSKSVRVKASSMRYSCYPQRQASGFVDGYGTSPVVSLAVFLHAKHFRQLFELEFASCFGK